MNAEKCEFFKDQINLCGRIIDRGELHKTPDTVDGILNAPRPLGFEHVLSIVFEDGSERPAAFASRSLNHAEKDYSQIDKEA